MSQDLATFPYRTHDVTRIIGVSGDVLRRSPFGRPTGRWTGGKDAGNGLYWNFQDLLVAWVMHNLHLRFHLPHKRLPRVLPLVIKTVGLVKDPVVPFTIVFVNNFAYFSHHTKWTVFGFRGESFSPLKSAPVPTRAGSLSHAERKKIPRSQRENKPFHTHVLDTQELIDKIHELRILKAKLPPALKLVPCEDPEEVVQE
jgi:hypothetical protein